MKKLLLLSLLVCPVFLSMAQTVYNTSILAPNIKTLQIYPDGEPLALPIIQLNSSDVLKVQFDEMSQDINSYNYRVFLCNKDWTASTLISNEYINGFTTGMISDYALSVNTTYLYTHYSFDLPNSDMSFTKSGNYIVQIYPDDDQDNPVAQAQFYIVDPKVSVTGAVTGNTDVELSGSLQQLNFNINLGDYNIQNANPEISVVIRQNNRHDNEVRNINPTFINGNVLQYQNNPALIFQGGNEYNRFDISSNYVLSERVEKISYDGKHYNAYLYPDKIEPESVYQSEPDANGGFVINVQNSYSDSEISADYFNVHFSIPRDQPFFDGQIYIGGEYNYNLLDANSLMQYDFNSGEYFKTLLLKQGGYSYQYWFLPKGKQKADVGKIEGSFWQTENQYAVYVYHRPWGGQYDKLICVKIFE